MHATHASMLVMHGAFIDVANICLLPTCSQHLLDAELLNVVKESEVIGGALRNDALATMTATDAALQLVHMQCPVGLSAQELSEAMLEVGALYVGVSDGSAGTDHAALDELPDDALQALVSSMMYSFEGSTAQTEVWTLRWRWDFDMFEHTFRNGDLPSYVVAERSTADVPWMDRARLLCLVCSELRNATKSCMSAKKHYFQQNIHSVITIQQYFRAHLRELECEVVPISQWRWSDGSLVSLPSRFCHRQKQERLTGCTGPPSRWVQRLNQHCVYSLPGGPSGPDLWYDVRDYVKFYSK